MNMDASINPIIHMPSKIKSSNSYIEKDVKFECSDLMCFSNKKPNNKIINIIKNKINKETDLRGYLRLCENIYLIKSVLFLSEEQEIFDSYLNLNDIITYYNNKKENFPLKSYYQNSFEPVIYQGYLSKHEEALIKLKRKFQKQFNSTYISNQ